MNLQVRLKIFSEEIRNNQDMLLIYDLYIQYCICKYVCNEIMLHFHTCSYMQTEEFAKHGIFSLMPDFIHNYMYCKLYSINFANCTLIVHTCSYLCAVCINIHVHLYSDE